MCAGIAPWIHPRRFLVRIDSPLQVVYRSISIYRCHFAHSVDTGRNICHGSDCVQAAEDEIKLWFDDAEINSWTSCAEPWVLE